MKRILILGLVAFAAWYGWKNYPSVLQRRPGHEAVIQNDSGGDLERVRLTVDGQTLVKEKLPDGERAVLPFKVNNDSAFELTWEWTGRMGERTWHGGMVPRGPMLQRHIFVIDGEGRVIYHPEHKI